MNSRFVARVALGVLSVLPASLGAQAPSAAGEVYYHYEPPKKAEYKELEKIFQEAKFLEALAEGIADTFELPADLTIVAGECGEPNAFYAPDDQTITLCYELVEEFAKLHTAASEDGDAEAIGNSVFGATVFVFFHEVGHALVDLFDLPITGKEEDAVDQLATVVLVESEDDAGLAAALDGAFTFLLQGQEGPDSKEEMAFWDEHSMDEQRFYNIACWVLGSDPEAFGSMVEDGWLPEDRAVRCPGEWAQTSKAWNRLLEVHMAE
jgi:hypothetical protein